MKNMDVNESHDSLENLHPRTMQTYMHPRAVSDLLYRFDAIRVSDERKSSIIANLHAEALRSHPRLEAPRQFPKCPRCDEGTLHAEAVIRGTTVRVFYECDSCDYLARKDIAF